jgi:hypothetical protein
VVGERVQKDWRRLGSNLYESEWEITLRNHKKENITVEVNEPMPGDWEVIRATHPHQKPQAFTAQWSLAVPREGSTTLTYRIRVRF